jgi:hypothetical protein
MVSSLPGAARKSAAIRQGKLEISNPIPVRRDELFEQATSIDHFQHRYNHSISSTQLETGTAGNAPLVLQDSSSQDDHGQLVMNGYDSQKNAKRASAALTTTYRSVASLPSAGSVRKSGGIKATLRRLFGTKRRRDTLITATGNQGSVSADGLYPGQTHFRRILHVHQADRCRNPEIFSTFPSLPTSGLFASHPSPSTS